MSRPLTPAQARYRAYLKTPHWQAFRRRILARAAEHCEWCHRFCGDPPHDPKVFCDDREECEWCRNYFNENGEPVDTERQRLEVHHLTYERVGHELNTDVAAICWTCHDGVSDRAIELQWRYKAGRLAKSDSTPQAAATRFWSILFDLFRRERGEK